MCYPYQQKNEIILNNVTTTGIGKVIDVRAMKSMTIVISTSGSANATIKVQGAIADLPAPNTLIENIKAFTSAQSISNNWFYIHTTNIDTAAGINGITGVVYTGTDGVTCIKVDTQSIDYITLNVTAISAGTIRAEFNGNNY